MGETYLVDNDVYLNLEHNIMKEGEIILYLDGRELHLSARTATNISNGIAALQAGFERVVSSATFELETGCHDCEWPPWEHIQGYYTRSTSKCIRLAVHYLSVRVQELVLSFDLDRLEKVRMAVHYIESLCGRQWREMVRNNPEHHNKQLSHQPTRTTLPATSQPELDSL